MASVIKAGNATDGVQVTSDNTGILELKTGTGSGTTAMTVGTDQAVTFAQAANLPNTFGFKNRIINGAMVIDQRFNGASTGSIIGAAYTLDRWLVIRVGGTSTLTVQRSTTAPVGFTNSLLVTAGSGATPAGTEERSLNQRIEGFNAADFGWGAANAQTVTLSFWVQSSVTGTFGVVLGNSAFNRSFVASYAISAANTWEYKTITIPGDTTGTWLKDSGNGLSIYWDLGVGTTYSGSATGAWQGSGFEGLTGGTKLSATSGATFYITGVQLEKGSTATSFDYRPYGTELQLCQRYFIQYGDNTTLKPISFGSASSTAAVDTLLSLPVEMRSVPTISASANLQASDWNNALTLTSPTLGGSTSKTLYLYGTVTGATQYRPYFIRTSASNGYIHFSAEL